LALVISCVFPFASLTSQSRIYYGDMGPDHG
jgi:hypothetical protein